MALGSKKTTYTLLRLPVPVATDIRTPRARASLILYAIEKAALQVLNRGYLQHINHLSMQERLSCL